MSNIASPSFDSEASLDSTTGVLLPREVPLGGPRAMLVRRTLPHRTRHMIGPWCFVDHFGPSSDIEMKVPPHPHTGLQTVSWLIDGQIRHNDNLGYEQLINPGELNLMTAGKAIAHAEVSTSKELHGIQLWVALPESSRRQTPHFEHHSDLPRVQLSGCNIIVMMGQVAKTSSPAATYWPTIAAEITLTSDQTQVPLDSDLEYGILAISHEAQINGQSVPKFALLDMGTGLSSLELESTAGSKFLLIGGAHFEEEIVMWWNFIGRSHEEIEQMRHDWQSQEGYAAVLHSGEWLPAPELPRTRLKSRSS